MKTGTDWLALWRELVLMKAGMPDGISETGTEEYWKKKAERFKKKSRKSPKESGSIQTFILSELRGNPNSTLLDIGAGGGDWSVIFSPLVHKITALEPSKAMRGLINEKISANSIKNIDLVDGSWPAVDIHPHDFVLASHSMYGEGDFKSFIGKMETSSNKGCFLVIKALYQDTIMAEAARRILGQPYDSPCLQIAYNALLQLGIFPNVLMETGKVWKSWSNKSIEEALVDIKNRLGLVNLNSHDEFLISLLESGLIKKEDKYFWPAGVGSALLYWNKSDQGKVD
ncbi:MAG: SAM-dependent methyltransferase [Proteobacteria bacterium]|nr:SAM-dependent methyltransferase [Pseudomonadota bacterium]